MPLEFLTVRVRKALTAAVFAGGFVDLLDTRFDLGKDPFELLRADVTFSDDGEEVTRGSSPNSGGGVLEVGSCNVGDAAETAAVVF